jgi:ABC-type sulfate transport system permease component
MKTFTAAEHEALEGLSSIVEIANAISELDINPVDKYDGVTVADHMYSISYSLRQIAEVLEKIEAKMK